MIGWKIKCLISVGGGPQKEVTAEIASQAYGPGFIMVSYEKRLIPINIPDAGFEVIKKKNTPSPSPK